METGKGGRKTTFDLAALKSPLTRDGLEAKRNRCAGVTWRICKPEYQNNRNWLRESAQMISAVIGVVGVFMLVALLGTMDIQDDRRALALDLAIASLYILCSIVAYLVVSGHAVGESTADAQSTRSSFFFDLHEEEDGDKSLSWRKLRNTVRWIAKVKAGTDATASREVEATAPREAPVAAPSKAAVAAPEGSQPLPQQRRLVLRFALARVAMALLVGTAAFALVSTAINISALPRCYDRPLEMTGAETDAEIERLAKASALFSKCTKECMVRQMQLGKGDAITWGLGKMTLLSGLAPTVEACESSFVANGMEVPWASDLAPWATGLPVGLALTELGLKCGEDARSKGCNVQTFAMAELLVTALVLGVLQISLVMVLQHSARHPAEGVS